MIARLTSQRGSAVIVSMAVLMLTLALGAVAGSRAMVVTHGAQRDVHGKRALQAADAGLRAAVDRLNRLDIENTVLPCVVDVDASPANVLLGYGAYNLDLSANVGDEWCPEVYEQLADGTSYRYRVGAAVGVNGSQVTLERTIVSFGSSGGRERRVAAEAAALTGEPLFGANAVISLDDLTMDNTATVQGSVRSNGNITLNNSAEICGDATPGPGQAVFGANACTLSVQPATSDLVLSPIEIGALREENDNARICQATMTDGQQGDVCTREDKIDGVGTSKLILNNSSTLHLGGSRYLLCRLELKNSSTLIIPAKTDGSAVQIYIDSPENCGGDSGFFRTNNAAIVNENGNPVTLQLYALGGSPVVLENRTVADMVIYAPESTVTLRNFARIRGAVAAKKVLMDNNVEVGYHDSVLGLTTEALFPLYRQERYRECPPAPEGEGPGAGCGT